jgi:hypothetical protein
LGGLPAGESRLLSFAEDLRTQAAWHQDNGASVASVTASSGVLKLDERLRWTTRVKLSAPAGEARELLVEIPRPDGAALAADNALKPVEETSGNWRFAVSLAVGETREIVIAAERITRQQVSLIEDDSVIAAVLGRPGLSPAATTSLRRLADLRTRKATRDSEVERLGEQVAKIEAEEERIRQNLAAVPANDALHARLVRQLDAAETRIDSLRKGIEAAEQAAAQAQKEYAAAVAGFTL